MFRRTSEIKYVRRTLTRLVRIIVCKIKKNCKNYIHPFYLRIWDYFHVCLYVCVRFAWYAYVCRVYGRLLFSAVTLVFTLLVLVFICLLYNHELLNRDYKMYIILNIKVQNNFFKGTNPFYALRDACVNFKRIIDLHFYKNKKKFSSRLFKFFSLINW